MKSLLMRYIKGRWFVITIFILLVFRAFFYNSIINIAHTPDLGYHIAVSDVYRQNPGTLFFWDVRSLSLCNGGKGVSASFLLNPFLYHSVIGNIWFLVERAGFNNAYNVTNLLQSLLGILTIFYIYLIAKLITKDRLTQILSLIFASCIPMFTFIIHYLTYDNLNNLLSAASIYYILKFIRKEKPHDLIILIILLLLGCITKNTFLPFALILSFILLIKLKFKLIFQFKKLFRFIFQPKSIIYFASLLFVFSVFSLYFGRNLYVYKQLFPASVNIKNIKCNIEPSQKKQLVRTIKNKLVAYEEKQDAENVYKIPKSKHPLRVDEYFIKWQATILWSTFNISSHRTLEKNGLINKGYDLIILIALPAIFWQIFKRNKIIIYLFLIFLVYIIFYFYYMYMIYQKNMIFGPSIQGRYLFPVMAAFIVPASYSILNITKNKYVRWALFISISVFFVYFDFFWFLRHYQVWYTLPPLDLPK